MTEMIEKFEGRYAYLSNFWEARLEWDAGWGEWEFKDNEHAYQASKCARREEAEAIRDCLTPGQAKRLGRKVQLVQYWEAKKEPVMKELQVVKFTTHPDLAELLIGTYPLYIIEGNDWGDMYWGVCNGMGQNRLGVILMEVREEFRQRVIREAAQSIRKS